MWLKYLLIVFLGLNACLRILDIGKEPKPTTREMALAVVILNSLLIIGILVYF